ncbi:hypothetical protein FQN57_004875 [Myotisia sp. PD_48]|nr:hypothetical protein FQN57_004875 [Myotisia sp. PD_48]
MDNTRRPNGAPPAYTPMIHPSDLDHTRFTAHVQTEGIRVNGVAPFRFPSRGVGVVAQRNLQPGEVIVAVPYNNMVTIDHIPESFREKFRNETISKHGLFAAFFCCGEQDDLEKYAIWKSVWPELQDFESSMPIIWSSEMTGRRGLASYLSGPEENDNNLERSQSGLPPCITGTWNSLLREGKKKQLVRGYVLENQDMLTAQIKRLRAAFRATRHIFPTANRWDYIYYWLIINTRCFYYLPDGAPQPEDRNDAMALCPFADYFNHSDTPGCRASFVDGEYRFETTRYHGEEILVSYGTHTTDTLFVEYGFVPERNKWDCLYLDNIIFDDLTTQQRNLLRSENYLGNYHMTADVTSYRTEVAACAKYMNGNDFRRMVAGVQPPIFHRRIMNTVIRSWISRLESEANDMLDTMSTLSVAQSDEQGQQRVRLLRLRWTQIRDTCISAMNSLENA